MELRMLYLLLILAQVSYSSCEIKNVRIADDPRPIILFERFGFSAYGRVTIYLENVSFKLIRSTISEPLDPSEMGFFLVKDQFLPHVINGGSDPADQFCILQREYTKFLFSFHSLAIDSTYNDTVVISTPDEYNLLFGNCQAGYYKLSMTVYTEMYNVHNGEKNFLPAGQIHSPELYFLFFVIYLGFLVIWVFICARKRHNLRKIHWIMGTLLLFKALKLLCASEDKLHMAKIGIPHSSDIAFYVFKFFKGTILFTMIVLLGVGWSILKPFLIDREKKLLAVVIPLQVLENVAFIIMEEPNPTVSNIAPSLWPHLFLIVDGACCMAVIFPVMLSIRGRREAGRRDEKASRNLEKVTVVRKLYVVVVCYLYFTRVVVFALGGIVGYRFEWIVMGVEEITSLGFYGFVFWSFKPVENNPYSVIDDCKDHVEIAVTHRRLVQEGEDEDHTF